MNKLQFPLLNNANKDSTKDITKNSVKDTAKDSTIRPKFKLHDNHLKASSISLYNCKEGVLDNWDDDFDINDRASKTVDSSSFTITPGILIFIYIVIFISIFYSLNLKIIIIHIFQDKTYNYINIYV